METPPPDNFIDPNHVTQTFVNGPITVLHVGGMTLIQFTQITPHIENLPIGAKPPPRQSMVACRLVMQEQTVKELVRVLTHATVAAIPVAGNA